MAVAVSGTPRVALVVAAAAAIIGFAGLSIAQRAGGRPVLHEPLSPASASSRAPSPLIGATGSGGNPTAIAAGDKVLPQPSLDAKPDDASEPVLGDRGFAADRATSMTPDYNTESDSTLHYVSVFNPDVLPFKRMSALDGIRDDYTLKIEHGVIAKLRVGGVTDKSRDRFWGAMAIDLRPGASAPLPSVAPDMRVLSYETKPPVALEFEKDGADNFYVRATDPRASGTYRLVFLADADAGYFAPSLPPHQMTARQLAAMVPPELRPIVPAAVMPEARRTLDRLGIDPDMQLGAAFNKLVGYFREFSAKAPPATSGNVYRDLIESKAGVCRHRSFAFMITANALGIPTRFVSNEAHAFVEVWFPERGWQRIDLGGAALKLDVAGANDKTLHRPRAEDPFAKPEAYKSNYTQLEGDIQGLSDSQLADKRRSLDQAPASGDFSHRPGQGNDSGDGAHANNNGGGGDADAAANNGGDRIMPDPNLPAATIDPKKPTPRLVVTTASATAYRGDSIHIEGRVDVGGKPLPEHRVDLFLAPAGSGGARSKLLGSAQTAADGTFRVDLTVPGGLELATYDIWLSSPEDAKFNAALSTQ